MPGECQQIRATATAVAEPTVIVGWKRRRLSAGGGGRSATPRGDGARDGRDIEPRNDESATRPASDALALVDVSFAYEGRTDRDGSRPALFCASAYRRERRVRRAIGANGTGKSTARLPPSVPIAARSH
jgi:hypothetical protein